jgi:hypothetical protein
MFLPSGAQDFNFLEFPQEVLVALLGILISQTRKTTNHNMVMFRDITN